jgi:Ice-binding-like
MKGTFKMKSKSLILSVVVALAGFLPQSQAALYDSFAVLAGSTVTSIGSTVLNGDLGAGTSISGFSGFPLGTVNGTTYINNSAASAHSAAHDEYTSLSLAGGAVSLTGQNLGNNRTLTPGVYRFGSEASLTGTLTLDGLGDSNARFVFQIGTTLTTDANSSIVLIGDVQAGNVFWQVGTSATLGANTAFNGSIFADTAITFGNLASMSGLAFANTAAVTLDANTITAVPEAAAFWPLVFCASVIGAWKYSAVWRRNPKSVRG